MVQPEKKNYLPHMLIAAWLLLCIPIFVASVPPFIDYPNHLARCFMLAHPGGGYEQYFQPDWALLPNLALELIVVPLAKILPIVLAGKLFLAILFGVSVYSGARLNKTLSGQWSVMGLASALLVYNRILSYGFLSYLFGVALLPLALALHIENRDLPKKRLAYDLILGAILFVSHLAAFALFVLCAFVYDYVRNRAEKESKRRIVRDVLGLMIPVVIAGALLVFASPTASQASHMHFNLMAKPKLFLSIMQTGIGLADYAFVGGCVIFLAYLAFKEEIAIAKYILPVLGVVFLLFLIAPDTFKDSRFMDARLPVALGALFLAALKPAKGFNGKVAAYAIGALLLFRVGTSTMSYAKWSKSLASVERDTKLIPPNSIVLNTKEGTYGFADLDGWEPRLRFQEDSLLSRQPDYIQDIFTFKGQQPLTNTPPYDQINTPTALGEVNEQVLNDYLYQAAHDLNGLGLANQPIFVYYIKESTKLPPITQAEVLVDRPHYAILRIKN